MSDYGALVDFDHEAGARVGQYLCQLLGVRPNGYHSLVFAAQTALEDGHGTSYGARTNNPLNLRPAPDGTWGGEVGVSPGGFSEFDTIESGARACALNYFNGPYASVRDACRRLAVATDRGLDAVAIVLAEAIEQSAWDAGRYGATIDGNHWTAGNLSKYVRDLLSQNGTDDVDPAKYAADLEDLVKATVRQIIVAEPGLVSLAIAAEYGPRLQAELDQLFGDLGNRLVSADQVRTVMADAFAKAAAAVTPA